MPRQTREERDAQARQDRIAKAVSEFRNRIRRERSKRVYDDATAFASTDTDPSLINLYELVHDYRTSTKDMRRTIANLQDRLTDAARKVDANERTYASAIVGSYASDLDMLTMRRDVLRDAVVRAAWTAGWYVPDVYDERDRAKRARLIAMDVCPDPRNLTWFVVIVRGSSADADHALTRRDVGINEGEGFDQDVPLTYRTEQDAWVAAMTYCGESIS